MKKKILFNNLIYIVLIAVCLFLPLNSYTNIFYMKDKVGDDYGCGDIKYPKNQLFNKKSLFDIKEYKVYKDSDNYCFKYDMANLDNSLNLKNGFSYVLIDTYISTSSVGLTSTLNYGACVKFDSNYPWKYHIRISPNDAYIEQVENIKTSKVSKNTNIILKKDKNSLILKVNKKYFSENLRTAKYYVFTGAYDVLGPDNYRRVVKEPSDFNLYGGNDSLYYPNVLDIVHPSQEKMLNSYIPPNYAVISPVYNNKFNCYVYKEFFVAILIIMCLISNYNFFKKK